MRTRARAAALALLPLLATSLSACVGSNTKVRLGYLPDANQAPAIVGIADGFFTKQLGKGSLDPSVYPSDTAAADALVAGKLDAAFIGPNAALSAYSQPGNPIRVLSGLTIGGAQFVANAHQKASINFAGTTVASPGVGSTQDVALRTWLTNKGYKVGMTGKDVRVRAMNPADTLAAMQSNTIAGAWLPEPWATRLLNEGKGTTVVNEAYLWKEGLFSTTLLAVRKSFIDKHPDTVMRLLQGLVDAYLQVKHDQQASVSTVASAISKLTGQTVSVDDVDQSWSNLTFGLDPVGRSIYDDDANAAQVGLMKAVPIGQMFDLTRINVVLRSKGFAEVQIK